MNSLIIPSSIQRIRSFLIEMCGMKVKPWANTEETLAALHTMLIARHRCDIFWTSLRVLLEKLAYDLKTRQDALPGSLVDNEVLDSACYTALLDEIRACLAQQSGDSSTDSFRRLASVLSVRALGLLLFLGGAATVGCDHATLRSAPTTQDAATQVADAKSVQPEAKADTPIFITLPPSPDVSPYTYVPPDVAPPWDAVAVGPDGATVTIQDIMNSCNVSSQEQSDVLACLSFLRTSWTTGLAQELAGKSCSAVDDRLDAFGCSSGPCQPGVAPDFVAGATPFCQPLLIYMGVRFV